MRKKHLLILFLIVITVALVCLCGCSKNANVDMTEKTPVYFELEGGKYQNCTGKITHYYDVEDGEQMKIYSPKALSSADCVKAGYTFGGWFKSKTVSGDQVSYTNEWNFENDKITSEGVTLYAKWDPIIKYTYVVCYYDEETGERKVINSYEVQEGGKFNDYLNYVETGRKGAWTPIAVRDSEGNLWNPDFTHPGGEKSTAIDVVVEFIKGRYKVCSTVEDLLNALDESSNSNIYLKSDIDCNGETLAFGNYMGEIIGNGYTISNFKVDYNPGKDGLDNDKLLNASILGNAYKAKISNVTFDNVILDYVSGFSGSQGIVIGVLGSRVESVTVSNVKVKNMKIILSELPNNMIDENSENNLSDSVVIVTDNLFAEIGANCDIQGECSVENVTLENNIGK